ncbi:MAG: S26 family signal peptidase, partial [Bryocella sp.]
DNRNDSEDSRYWGFVPQQSIVARPALVYLSIAPPSPSTGSLPHRIAHNLRAEFAAIRILH